LQANLRGGKGDIFMVDPEEHSASLRRWCFFNPLHLLPLGLLCWICLNVFSRTMCITWDC